MNVTQKYQSVIDPTNKSYLRPDGTIVFKVKHAFYGCIEYARLLYETLCKGLQKLGFVKTAHDHSVFNRTEEDGLLLIFLNCESVK